MLSLTRVQKELLVYPAIENANATSASSLALNSAGRDITTLQTVAHRESSATLLAQRAQIRLARSAGAELVMPGSACLRIATMRAPSRPRVAIAQAVWAKACWVNSVTFNSTTSNSSSMSSLCWSGSTRMVARAHSTLERPWDWYLVMPACTRSSSLVHSGRHTTSYGAVGLLRHQRATRWIAVARFTSFICSPDDCTSSRMLSADSAMITALLRRLWHSLGPDP
mmetsp:Transcript_36837/g.88634  ORF Transcript_36837/g.88634 Transcript_36837/m.88634 type:complete len:225 (-) Transcript_36837:534-1208(-)